MRELLRALIVTAFMGAIMTGLYAIVLLILGRPLW